MTEQARRPLIAGNWKMNFHHRRAVDYVKELGQELHPGTASLLPELALFPPFTAIPAVAEAVGAAGLPVQLGGQDISTHPSGAYTGEISGEFLAELGCSHVIVGHSERRYRHVESDETVAAKTKAALAAGLVPIICVGETAKDLERHAPSAVPANQLRGALLDVQPADEIVVAYEPVWAIGSGQAASAQQAQDVAAVLRQVLAQTLDDQTASRARILYGGSVNATNAAEILAGPDVDGALVGTASLEAASFAAIVRAATKQGTRR